MAEHQVDLESAKAFLRSVIARETSEEALQWLDQKVGQLETQFVERDFYLAFGMMPRRLGKGELNWTADELQRADALRPGFCPQHWNLDETGRVLLVLTIPATHEEQFRPLLDKLFSTAEVGELVALYASLPLLPFPESHHARATEGIRTNMTVVFDAVALNNPYPTDYLSENAWNQLVLKAIFMGRPLYQIVGLDRRRNERLAQMLIDFAHERWAAGRRVAPELWRGVGPFLTAERIADIKRLFESEEPDYQEAAALACSESSLPESNALLGAHETLKSKIENRDLTWESLGERLWKGRPA